MKNTEHIHAVRQGAAGFRNWRESNPTPIISIDGASLEGLDLRGIDLRNASMKGCSFRRSSLFGANLRNSNLSDADLSEADLRMAWLNNANLQRAILTETRFQSSVLIGADMRNSSINACFFLGADLSQARLDFAYIRGAVFGGEIRYPSEVAFSYSPHVASETPTTNFEATVFTGSKMAQNQFSNVDLSVAIGLEDIRHDGRSSIGVDTIMNSGGTIPEKFMRGCGYHPHLQGVILGDSVALTDAAYDSTEGKSIVLQSCFISYSTLDAPFVELLQKSLNGRGVDYWYAPQHGRLGALVLEQIDQAIHTYDRLIVVCSSNSLMKSEWVRREIFIAKQKQERDGNTVIFPVVIDDTLFNMQTDPDCKYLRMILAADFREKTVPCEGFDVEFERLLAGLSAGKPT